MRHYLTGDLHTQVVEAHTSVGAVGQSEGSGDHTMGVGSMVQVGVDTSSINKGISISITLANHMSVSSESSVSSVTSVSSESSVSSVSRQSSIGGVGESSIVVVVIESISSINKRGGVSCIIQKGISISLGLSISISHSHQGRYNNKEFHDVFSTALINA